MYSVYKHTAPNGKCYIGITKQTPQKRWLNGHGYRTQKRFYRAIQKYGWNSFSHEVLYSGLTLDEAEAKEKELILEYKSFDKNFGYNIENGGSCKKEVSEETREKLRKTHKTEAYLVWMQEKNAKRWSDPDAHTKMSERFSDERNPMYGKKLSEEHKQKISEALSGRKGVPLYGEKNPFYGKQHSEEAKAKISETNFGAKNGKARRVLCVETNVVYGCIREAHRETGIRFDSISSCCRGVTKTAGGYHWRYADEGGVAHV